MSFENYIESKLEKYVDKIDRAIYNGSCENPVYLGYDPLYPIRQVYVPCGHCFSCLNVTKQDWIVRNNFESMCYEDYNKCFITLTLDEKRVNNTSYEDVQLFLKRYRRYLDYHFHRKIKYFGCFERGDKNNRPHFHILIYGDNPQYWKQFRGKSYKYINAWFVENIWKRGIVEIDAFSGDRIGYVVGYVLKKSIKTRDIAKDLNKSRRMINYRNKHSKSDLQAGFDRFEYYFNSQKLGFAHFIQNMNKIIKRLKVNIADYTYRIPRYFVKKVKELFDLDIFEKVRKSSQKLEKFLKWLNVDNMQDVDNRGDFIFNAIAEYNQRVIDNNKIKNYNRLQRMKMRC